MRIEGSAAIVTGGASGLGEASAIALAAAGAHVTVLDQQEELGRLVAERIGGSFAAADVADTAQVAEAVRVAGAAGPLRVLVNCAGLSRPGRTVNRDGEPLDLASFEFVLRVNLTGTFNCIRLAAAAMARTEALADGQRGAIVNTASAAAFDGQIGQASYSASKAGITGMTLPLARDLALIGVRVNTIAPGLFDTPIFVPGTEPLMEKLARNTVFPQRAGRPDEFADLVLSCLRNDYLNGEVVRLDGAARMPPR